MSSVQFVTFERYIHTIDRKYPYRTNKAKFSLQLKGSNKYSPHKTYWYLYSIMLSDIEDIQIVFLNIYIFLIKTNVLLPQSQLALVDFWYPV